MIRVDKPTPGQVTGNPTLQALIREAVFRPLAADIGPSGWLDEP
jgi:hypothetical protein